MIRAKNIFKRFDKPVLRNVTLEVTSGETLSLIGPSGCGKSTLLRIIMGLIPADDGSVELNGEHLHHKNVLTLRRKMGYVIQNGGLFPHMSARENLTVLTHYLGWSKKREQDRVDELLDLTSISGSILNRKPEQLSGGQAQRISLMRALMLDPPILLMDEPLGSIDPLVRYELQNDLRSIFRKLDKTVLLVTHDLGEAAFLGNRIALMQSGEIVQQGSLEELVRNPRNEFVKRFVQAQRSPLEGIDHE
ncbi:MAG: ATP-binding cassette domain-containing protein [Bacteroidetes bacterium]|jgi:osmoprotectant transport system ATP-binding protein|nr:ATP-binding cassette domain-containing protein [Bacteroidota bacterium]